MTIVQQPSEMGEEEQLVKPSSGTEPLDAGGIAGVVIGGVAAIVILIAIIAMVAQRRFRAKQAAEQKKGGEQQQHAGGSGGPSGSSPVAAHASASDASSAAATSAAQIRVQFHEAEDNEPGSDDEESPATHRSQQQLPRPSAGLTIGSSFSFASPSSTPLQSLTSMPPSPPFPLLHTHNNTNKTTLHKTILKRSA